MFWRIKKSTLRRSPWIQWNGGLLREHVEARLAVKADNVVYSLAGTQERNWKPAGNIRRLWLPPPGRRYVEITDALCSMQPNIWLLMVFLFSYFTLSSSVVNYPFFISHARFCYCCDKNTLIHLLCFLEILFFWIHRVRINLYLLLTQYEQNQ